MAPYDYNLSLPPDVLDALLNGPALPTPPGITPHLNNRAQNEHLIYMSGTLCMVIAGIFLILRIYTKIRVDGKFDVADYLIVIGFCCLAGEVAIGRVTLDYGGGAHQWNIQLKNLFKILYYMNIGEILYAPCILSIKLSLLTQYLSLLAPTRTVNRLVHDGSHILILLNTLFYTADILLTILACTPREKIWNKLYPGGTCVNYHAVIAATGVWNVVSDIAILVLPVTTVWRLRIPVRKKAGASVLFGAGLSACVASALRILYTSPIIRDEATADISFNLTWMGIWTLVEISLGLVIACLLSVSKLVKEGGVGFGGWDWVSRWLGRVWGYVKF